MKATRQEEPKKFVPVTLTLETQAEVDALAALLCYSELRELVELESCIGHSSGLLDLADDNNRLRLHARLCKVV